MRKHNGMRPQDIAILLKIISMDKKIWQQLNLAAELRISISEVSESLNRSKLAGLIDPNKKMVNRQNLVEFLEHGLRYVFPTEPGATVRGIPTAHSHPFMKKMFSSNTPYVWPSNNGNELGLTIEPLYNKQVEAVREDPEFYKLMALVDVVRVGKAREIQYALTELKKIVSLERSH